MASLSERKTTLELVLHAAGVGWLLQEDKDGRLTQVLGEMDDLSVDLSRRLAPLLVDVLVEAASGPSELRPLVQLFASPTTMTARAMAYCVLHGADVKSVSFEYEMYQTAKLKVVLSDTARTLAFETNELYDVEVLRHFGIMKSRGRPVLHGYYAFAD